MGVKMLETCRVGPFTNSATPLAELSIPLTYFDITWLKTFPYKNIMFYQLGHHESPRIFFNSEILPKLKHSLSLTLSHFLPMVGNIIWPIDSVKPFVLYTPNDNISLIVAESDSDFNHLVKNEMQEATDLHPYFPELFVSQSKASIIAIQITSFPGQGFSIGICLHHGMLSGKSVAILIKAWAHICKENFDMTTLLPLELGPVLDRSVIHYPQKLDMLCLNNLFESSSDPNRKSLKPLGVRTNFDNLVRASFEFSHQDINRLRQKIISILNQQEKEVVAKHMHLSAFVLSYAYTLVCIVQAKKVKGNICLKFSADLRSRLEPPIPENYFGNCVIESGISIDVESILDNGRFREENRVLFPHVTTLPKRDSDGQDINGPSVNPLMPPLKGVAFVAKRISEKIKGLETRAMSISIEAEMENMLELKKAKECSDLFIGVSWSPKFKIYNGTDFGWGKPKKVQTVSIDNNGSIFMSESRDGSGGIEIGLVMKGHEMESFNFLFYNGLRTTISHSLL